MSRLAMLLLALIFPGLAATGLAQEKRDPSPTGGIYSRPFIARAGGTAIGGYAEFNSNWIRQDGVSEGFSFENRRFNVFLFSSISDGVRLTSELEFEHGTEEIALETALVDVLLATSLNIRGGVLLAPIGKFNIAHDSPRYNVIDRPLVSTGIIPATLSEVGAGFFGGFYPSEKHRITYEVYAVNGLQDGVVLGEGEGTRIPGGKAESAVEEDNNGSPAFTGRLAFNPLPGGEFGLSAYTGQYNTDAIEGSPVDEERFVSLFAADAELERGRFLFRGEAALADIDVPRDHVDDDFLASGQRGFYAEANYTFFKRPWLNFDEAAWIAFLRYDGIDLNTGTFDATRESIGDSSRRVTAGVAFRPTPDTVIRLSGYRQWDDDTFRNRSDKMNVQWGVATYF